MILSFYMTLNDKIWIILFYFTNYSICLRFDFSTRRKKQRQKETLRDYYLCVFITTTYQYTITHTQNQNFLL